MKIRVVGQRQWSRFEYWTKNKKRGKAFKGPWNRRQVKEEEGNSPYFSSLQVLWHLVVFFCNMSFPGIVENTPCFWRYFSVLIKKMRNPLWIHPEDLKNDMVECIKLPSKKKKIKKAAWGHLASWGFCSRTGDRDWNVLPWRYSQLKVPLFCWDSWQFLVKFLCVFGYHTEKHLKKLMSCYTLGNLGFRVQDSSKENFFLLYEQWRVRQWGVILGKQYS